MISPKTYTKPKPVQAGLVVCSNRRCEAQYKPVSWTKGYYEEGTSGRFIETSPVKDGCCPRCGTNNTI